MNPVGRPLPSAILAFCLCCLGGIPAAAFDSVVVFNEIHYHPDEPGDPNLEFVEIYNQYSVDVDLSGWRITGGIEYTFPRRSIIGGGSYLVVAADPAAVRALGGLNVKGPYTGMLDNGGETLRLRNHNRRVMDEVSYNDRAPWPVEADGSGSSISKIDPQSGGADPRNWSHSLEVGGTPGVVNFEGAGDPFAINELAGSSGGANAFFVEVYNSDGEEHALDGYVIVTESGDEFVVPDETTVGANEVVQFGRDDLGFHARNNETVTLYQPGKASVVDALRTDNLGRVRIPDGSEKLFFAAGGIAASPGALNPPAPVSPIVINEIMYHHRPTYPDAGPPRVAYAENKEEWIELHNTADIPVPVGGWRLDGAVGYTIPENTLIPEGGYLVITRDAVAFAAKFPGVPVLGDFSGSLSNRGEEILLLDQVGNEADQVHYLDGKPWPDEADGGGSSLELINPLMDNSVPEAWAASDNSERSEWKSYEFDLRALQPTYSPGIFNFHELRLGLLDSGVVLIDDVSVVEDPSAAASELIENGGFRGTAGWKMIGTHQASRQTSDDGERVLRIVADGRMNYLNNLIEGNLTLNGAPHPVRLRASYRISFRAKWISGTPQFRFELYYNRLAKTVILEQPEQHGTPGEQNTSYREDTGPTFRGMRHSPAVPTSDETIEISSEVSDPSGIRDVMLRYSLDAGSFQTKAMALDSEDGRWKVSLPAQANGTLIHFYLEAHDAGPDELRSLMPAGGSRSRALIKVDSSNLHRDKHSVRIVMVSSDSTSLHNSREILSNLRKGCTIITDEKDIAYDAGIRLRGSMFSRGNSSSTGLNLKFPSDRKYRGVHGTITTRKGNMREILVKHIVNQAGGLHDNYNDLLFQYGHIPGQVGMARTEMARFGTNYLRGLPGGNGTEGTIFKMEGIREFQATQDGTPDTPKLPMPIGWVRNFDLADQGADKEMYRHNMRINTSFDRDEYSEIMRMCQTFSLSGRALERAAPRAINVDMWCRQFALMSLCGIGDTYSQGNPHNLNFYVRPGDGLVEPIPWDWDFTFNRGTSSPFWGDRNVAKLFALPVYRRIYHGHLYDLVRNIYNERALRTWFEHYGTCAGESYIGNLNYVRDRGNWVLSQLPAQISFGIETNGGADFSTDSPQVTLTGEGWINVRDIYFNDADEPVELRWTGESTWEFDAALAPGSNTLNLSARDYRGNEVASASVVVTNTGVVEAASASNIALTEVNYNPAGAVAEEFVELTNIGGSVTVDLSGASFSNGIDFVFPSNTLLGPGGVILVVENVAVFRDRYGDSARVAGVFASGSNLDNAGERLRFQALGGETIRDFSYDNKTPWPEAADDLGFTMVLIDPPSDPDHADPLNWRASVATGGNPGESDAAPFTGDPDADDNGDGLSNFLNHAFGPGHLSPDVEVTSAGRLRVSYPRNLAADDVRWFIDLSTDLENWTPMTDEMELRSESTPVEGVSTVVYRSLLPLAPERAEQYVRVRVEKR